MAGIFRIEQFEFEDLCNYIRENRFQTDGCFCGEIIYELSAGFYIGIFRSCHKSSGCPDNEWWHVADEPEFWVNIPKENDGSFILGERSGEINLRLCKDQWIYLRELAIRKSQEEYDTYWR